MKNFATILGVFVILSSCSTSKEARLARANQKEEKKALEQAVVKNAVESRKFIIKFDKLFLTYGGVMQLIPRANYLIVDGERATLSTAYLGRQYDVKPIAAINMRGRANDFSVTDNQGKGRYEIKLRVENKGSVAFTVFLTISKSGSCQASVSSLKIDNVRYSGYLVPIPLPLNTSPKQQGNVI